MYPQIPPRGCIDHLFLPESISMDIECDIDSTLCFEYDSPSVNENCPCDFEPITLRAKRKQTPNGNPIRNRKGYATACSLDCSAWYIGTLGFQLEILDWFSLGKNYRADNLGTFGWFCDAIIQAQATICFVDDGVFYPYGPYVPMNILVEHEATFVQSTQGWCCHTDAEQFFPEEYYLPLLDYEEFDLGYVLPSNPVQCIGTFVVSITSANLRIQYPRYVNPYLSYDISNGTEIVGRQSRNKEKISLNSKAIISKPNNDFRPPRVPIDDGVLHPCMPHPPIPLIIGSEIVINPTDCSHYLDQCNENPLCVKNTKKCGNSLIKLGGTIWFNNIGDPNLDNSQSSKIICSISNDRVNGTFGLIYEVTGWDYFGYSEESGMCEAIVNSRLSFCAVSDTPEDPNIWGIERYIDINKYVVCPPRVATNNMNCCFVEGRGSIRGTWKSVLRRSREVSSEIVRGPYHPNLPLYLWEDGFWFGFIFDNICVFESYCWSSAFIDWKQPVNNINWNDGPAFEEV